MHFSVFDVEAETWRRVDIPEEAWYYGEHSVSIFSLTGPPPHVASSLRKHST